MLADIDEFLRKKEEKKKKELLIAKTGRLKTILNITGERAEKEKRERGKEELPLKQKARSALPKGCGSWCFFAFRFRCFQPWANFYSTVL